MQVADPACRLRSAQLPFRKAQMSSISAHVSKRRKFFKFDYSWKEMLMSTFTLPNKSFIYTQNTSLKKYKNIY